VDDLTHELASLRDKVEPAWGPARSEIAYRELGRARRRRRMRYASTVASIGALGIVVGLTYVLPRVGFERGDEHASPGLEARAHASTHESSRPAAVAVTGKETLRAGQRAKLADGSTVELTAPSGELTVDINQPDHVSLHLGSGTAHFEVAPNTQRRFSVFVDTVEVVVIGTAFDVEARPGLARVAVTHGTVRVRSSSGVMLVRGGEARWFEQAEHTEKLPAAESGSRPVTRAATPHGVKAGAAPRRARPEWRSLNQSGDYESAYRMIEHGAAVVDDPEALMEAADAARLTDHPIIAVSYLQKVLSEHRASPTAPLAAFTLGRVLLERLGRPTEAAAAFSMARELAPHGSLAQDALAREVESWSNAGHAREANERSRLFAQLYPNSRRLRVVQLYGGIAAQ
jgi:transmembrane sensor